MCDVGICIVAYWQGNSHDLRRRQPWDTCVLDMRQIERASICRVLRQLLLVDGNVNDEHFGLLLSLYSKYSIQKDDEVYSMGMTLASALNALGGMADVVREQLSEDVRHIGHLLSPCPPETSILLFSCGHYLSSDPSLTFRMISVPKGDAELQDYTLLYIEDQLDEDINANIRSNLRSIQTEAFLMGWQFVYIPTFTEYFRQYGDSHLLELVSVIHPDISEAHCHQVGERLQSLTTERFCRDYIQHVFAEYAMPEGAAFLLKVPDTYANGQSLANYLVFDVWDDALSTLRQMIRVYTHLTPSLLPAMFYRQSEWQPFHCWVINRLVQCRGVRSRVVVDIHRGDILLPDIGATVQGLYRREKALYLLFLIEAGRGGINLSRPRGGASENAYLRRMKQLQMRYSVIYEKFGGERGSAPDLSNPEILMPMVSLLKRKILAFDALLLNATDYIIRRNAYGLYEVGVSRDICFVTTDTPGVYAHIDSFTV